MWQDITRLVEVVSERAEATHFIGAIVLQQQQVPLGELQAWSVIDGQQRLTTLQLLLDDLHAELTVRDWAPIAGQVVDLVENSEAFRSTREDQFKLWPTNRDRASFSAVMRATPRSERNVARGQTSPDAGRTDYRRDAGRYTPVDATTGRFQFDGIYNAVVDGDNPFGFAYAGIEEKDADGATFGYTVAQLIG